MRSALLVVAAMLLGVSLFVRGWAGASLRGIETYDDARVEVGLRSAAHCAMRTCEAKEPHTFVAIGRTGELEGGLASFAIGLAALAMLVAAWLVRGGPLLLGVRLALAGACALAMILSIVFALRVSQGYLHVGWVAYEAVIASFVGALLILVERRRP
jgi:hypothetical protein